MNEEEMVEALLKGAFLRVSDSGETTIQALDDVSPEIRACVYASIKRDATHFARCPDCLDDEAMACLMDAASHRDDGNEADALALERRAEALRIRAAKLRRT